MPFPTFQMTAYLLLYRSSLNFAFSAQCNRLIFPWGTLIIIYNFIFVVSVYLPYLIVNSLVCVILSVLFTLCDVQKEKKQRKKSNEEREKMGEEGKKEREERREKGKGEDRRGKNGGWEERGKEEVEASAGVWAPPGVVLFNTSTAPSPS